MRLASANAAWVLWSCSHLPILHKWQVSARASRPFTTTINVDHIVRHSQCGLGASQSVPAKVPKVSDIKHILGARPYDLQSQHYSNSLV
jgi:hypothetical protein